MTGEVCRQPACGTATRSFHEHADHRERGVQRWGVKPACAVLSTHGIGIAPWTYYEHVGFEGTHYRLIRPDAVARLLHIQRVKRPFRRSRACWWVPPAGFEPALPPPEGGALSPELRGPKATIHSTFFRGLTVV